MGGGVVRVEGNTHHDLISAQTGDLRLVKKKKKEFKRQERLKITMRIFDLNICSALRGLEGKKKPQKSREMCVLWLDMRDTATAVTQKKRTFPGKGCGVHPSRSALMTQKV